MKRRRLVADVGGTWTRLGVSSGPGDLTDVKIYPTAERHSFAEVLAEYVAGIDAESPSRWCSGAHVAAAGAIDQGRVVLTNARWQMSTDEVSINLGGVPVRFVNDLEAVGLLLPHVHAEDVRPIGPVMAADLVGNRIAVNIGTGFGAATALRSRGGWKVAPSEAGHMSLTTRGEEEAPALAWSDTVEDVLSGLGVVRLYERLAGRVDRPGETFHAVRTADAVIARAHADPVAAEAVRLLSRLIGRVTGDLVLATAAWDGAFLCGSVARAWMEVGDAVAFRAEFERKGSMSDRMRRVPAYALLIDEPALRGLTYGEIEDS